MTSASLAEVVIERTKELVATPAPPLDEGDRASLVGAWWTGRFNEVVVDDIGNVWACAQPGPGPALVLAAHMDTVFGRDIAHGSEARDGRLYGPSVGDDSVAVASLAAVAELLPADCGHVWLLATVGEEGLGNLAGIRHALRKPQVPIGAVVALDGNWLGRVCTTAVGSIRYRVTLRGPGGHAWEAADADSAVHGAARIIAALDRELLPDRAKSSVNVGTIAGGTAINARAHKARFDVDLRASSQDTLDDLDRRFRRIVDLNRRDLEDHWECIGRRPAGAIDPDHELCQSAIDALGAAGIKAELTAGSTDANAAHAVGIPAIALGVTRGAQEHTIDEWIELAPIATGLQVLADTIYNYTRSRR